MTQVFKNKIYHAGAQPLASLYLLHSITIIIIIAKEAEKELKEEKKIVSANRGVMS